MLFIQSHTRIFLVFRPNSWFNNIVYSEEVNLNDDSG
jgi:hypothetical protein